MKESFRKGNFNEWEELFNAKLPFIIKEIREDVVPSIDAILLEMLGNVSTVEKDSIDLYPVFNQSNLPNQYADSTQVSLLSNFIPFIECKLCYSIQDFKADNIPQDIIQKDIDTIKEAFLNTVPREVTLDIKTGELTFIFRFELEN